MINTFKAEVRKLLSVRSTYIISALALAIVIFVGFYVEGWRLHGAQLKDPTLLTQDVTGSLVLTIFGAIVAILLMTHEYRYNTIMYTLTINNSRLRVLAAKILVVSLYAIFLTVLVGVLAPIMTYLGVHAHGHSLAPQIIHFWDLAWRSLFYGWAYAMAGLLLAVLIRSQPGTVAALFLLPGLAEQLIGQLLDKKAVYLPFTSLNMVIGNSAPGGGQLKPVTAAVVFGCYLVLAWLIAGILFNRRDAA